MRGRRSAIEAFPSKYQNSRKSKDASLEGEVYSVLFGYRTTKGEQAVYNVSLAGSATTICSPTSARTAEAAAIIATSLNILLDGSAR